ncbi:MAG: hypothetical protein Q8865_05545 [Bacillota bacterium]|nr:hypothetical protein [Bacillota bacterium]
MNKKKSRYSCEIKVKSDEEVLKTVDEAMKKKDNKLIFNKYTEGKTILIQISKKLFAKDSVDPVFFGKIEKKGQKWRLFGSFRNGVYAKMMIFVIYLFAFFLFSYSFLTTGLESTIPFLGVICFAAVLQLGVFGINKLKRRKIISFIENNLAKNRLKPEEELNEI